MNRQAQHRCQNVTLLLSMKVVPDTPYSSERNSASHSLTLRIKPLTSCLCAENAHTDESQSVPAGSFRSLHHLRIVVDGNLLFGGSLV
eukprot:2069192-Amphidinium_carterae.1